MIKYFTFLILSFSTCHALAQQFELAAGANRNTFLDITKENGNPRSTFKPDGGFSIFVSYGTFVRDSFPIRFSLAFEKYSGHLVTSISGFSGQSTTELQTGKYSIGLAIFPANITFFHAIVINAGPEINYLLDYTTDGHRQTWGQPAGDTYTILDHHTENLYKRINIGFRSRLAFPIHLKNNWSIIPEYQFYYGITNEFKTLYIVTHSLRHFVGIGIGTKLY